jgi:hypothetical protein
VAYFQRNSGQLPSRAKSTLGLAWGRAVLTERSEYSRMRRGIIYTLGILSVGVLALLVAERFSPMGRTKAYFALQSGWESHWPLDRGRHAPRHLRRVFEPFVPVWMEIETGVHKLLDPEDLVSRWALDHDGKWEEESLAVIKQHLPVGRHIRGCWSPYWNVFAESCTSCGF